MSIILSSLLRVCSLYTSLSVLIRSSNFVIFCKNNMIIKSKLHRLSGNLVSGELITNPLLSTDAPGIHTYIQLVQYQPSIDNGIILTFIKNSSTNNIKIYGNVQGKVIRVGLFSASKIFASSIKFSKFEYNDQSFNIFIGSPPILVPLPFVFLLPGENPIPQPSSFIPLITISIIIIVIIALILLFWYFMNRNSKQ